MHFLVLAWRVVVAGIASLVVSLVCSVLVTAIPIEFLAGTLAFLCFVVGWPILWIRLVSRLRKPGHSFLLWILTGVSAIAIGAVVVLLFYFRPTFEWGG